MLYCPEAVCVGLHFQEAVSEGFLNPREASPEGCPWIRGVNSVELSDGLLQLVAVEHVPEAAGAAGRSVVGGRAYRRRLGRRRHTAGGLAAVEGVLGRVLGLLQAAESRHRLRGREKKIFLHKVVSFWCYSDWDNKIKAQRFFLSFSIRPFWYMKH